MEWGGGTVGCVWVNGVHNGALLAVVVVVVASQTFEQLRLILFIIRV